MMHDLKFLYQSGEYQKVIFNFEHKHCINSSDVVIYMKSLCEIGLYKDLYALVNKYIDDKNVLKQFGIYLHEFGFYAESIKYLTLYFNIVDSVVEKSYYIYFLKNLFGLNLVEEAKSVLRKCYQLYPESKYIKNMHKKYVTSGIPNENRLDKTIKMGRLSLSVRSICDFLYYGYLPSVEKAECIASEYSSILNDSDIEIFDSSDTKTMADLLDKIVYENVERTSESSFRIGVSSGLDSRALLSSLSRCVELNNIYPFTVGTEGNKDVTLAPIFLDKKFKNYELKLTAASDEVSIETSVSDDLILPGITFDAKISKNIKIKSQKKNPSLSSLKTFNGYLGDPMAGSRVMKDEPSQYDVVKQLYAKENGQYVKRKISNLIYDIGVFPREYSPTHVLPSQPILPPNLISPLEQLDLFYRQGQYIRLLAPQQWRDDELELLPESARQKFKVKRDFVITPFSDKRWIRSFLSVEKEKRFDCVLYKQFLRTEYPTFFPDLVNPNDIRWSRVIGATNLDWGYLWNNSLSFRDSALEVLMALKKRALWFDPLIVVKLAEENVKGFSVLLKGFCALELNIRAGRLPNPGEETFKSII